MRSLELAPVHFRANARRLGERRSHPKKPYFSLRGGRTSWFLDRRRSRLDVYSRAASKGPLLSANGAVNMVHRGAGSGEIPCYLFEDIS